MKNSLKLIVLSLVAVLCLSLSACGNSTPESLEAYFNDNPDVMESVESSASATEGLSVTAKDNELIYKYDVSNLDGFTKDIALSKESKETFAAAIDEAADTYKEVCSGLEEQIGVSGITCTITYTYKDEVIVSKTFSAE